MFFGLQYLLQLYLEGEVTNYRSLQADRSFHRAHFGQDLFNMEGWRRIAEKHDGRLPISIKAVPEGTVVPVSNVLMTIENTDEEVPWLTNWVETLLVQLW